MPDEPADLFADDLERRALAHLPRYRAHGEKVDVHDKFKDGEPVGKARKVDAIEHMREVGGHPEDWEPPQALSLHELRRRLADDEFSPSPEQDALFETLEALEEKGYVERAGDVYAMTADGLEALTA